MHQFAGEGNLKRKFFLWAQCAGEKFVDICRGMDEEDVLVARRLGFEEVGRFGDGLGDQTVVDEAVFLRGKDVGADWQIVSVAVDELEGEHG